MTSIQNTLNSLRERHVQYLEAGYHLRFPRLIDERRKLIEEGTTYSEPWVDVMTSYAATRPLANTQLPSEVKQLILDMKANGLIKFDPPYDHQTEGLEAFFSRNKDLLVSTGTGSGKTEIFLWSLLGHLAQEAHRGRTTKQRGVRAILLYPMNALAADQLSRLRLLLGSTKGKALLRKLYGRPIQFGMFTGRTPYPGPRLAARDEERVRPIIDHFDQLAKNNIPAYQLLEKAGRVPAKDLRGFGGANGQAPFTTGPDDAELLTRQEMYAANQNGGTPDLLITNNFMLEYMLLRPIEQGLFDDTRKWLEDPENKLLLILDEAHLYRGAQGAEVALLVRRLIQHLGVPRERIRCILTSASMGTPTQAKADGPKFASQLTAGSPQDFEVILGVPKNVPAGTPGDIATAQALSNLQDSLDPQALQDLAAARTWPNPASLDTKELGANLAQDPLFHTLYHLIKDPKTLDAASSALFPKSPPDIARKATLGLLNIAAKADSPTGGRLLPSRVHQFFKGLPGLHACLRPTCDQRRANDPTLGQLLGHIYTEPRIRCKCDARVYELLSHRDCGAAYIRAFRRKDDSKAKIQFFWNESGHVDDLEEVHVLLEQPRDDAASAKHGKTPMDKTLQMFMDIETGYVRQAIPTGHPPGRYIKVWLPDPNTKLKKPDWPRTWVSCPVCGKRGNRRPMDGMAKVMDLETKGEEPFANLASTLFSIQDPDPAKTHLHNKGRKLLAFSDGRQKAARLARDLQRSVEQDTIRTAMLAAAAGGIQALHQLYAAFVEYSKKHGLHFFDDADASSRQVFGQHLKDLDKFRTKYQIPNGTPIWQSDDALQDLDASRPAQYNELLLRSLGDRFYSFHGTTAAYCRPTDDVFRHLKTRNPAIDPRMLEDVLVETVRFALEDRAYDASISDPVRARSRGGYPDLPEGYDSTQILPDHVANLVRAAHGDAIVDSLRNSLTISESTQPKAPRLFSPSNNRWYLNPTAVILQPAINHTWYRCTGCRQFSHVYLSGRCPHCGGENEPVGPLDAHRRSRKEFFLDPVTKALAGVPPTTIRSEEHSAQITTKDEADIWSRAEQYELLFQDILTQDPLLEPPIDVLSCTTTMEVGINIGALTGVAMRTIPPRRDNYQQRAGRAGRAGSPLSTILTFADNSPHETYVFRNPDRLIAAPATPPIIYIENERLLERHLNAAFIQNYYRYAVPTHGIPVGQKGNDLLTVLGQAMDFLHGAGNITLTDYLAWSASHLSAATSPLVIELALLIPPEVEPQGAPGWQAKRVLDRSKAFENELSNLAAELKANPPTDPEYGLLTALLDSGLLPRFSFPLYATNFTVTRSTATGIHKDYDMTQDRAKALSEYAPGRHVVVDKHTFESYGLSFKFPPNPTHRAQGPHWINPRWIHFCSKCQSVLADENPPGAPAQCPIPTCNAPMQGLPYIVPEGFAPQVRHGHPQTTDDYEDERVYAVPAIYPLPNFPPAPGSASRPVGTGNAEMRPNEELHVANFGPGKSGFHICHDCGAIDREGPPRPGHGRPYATNNYAPHCGTSSTKVALVHKFRTDMCLLTIPFGAQARFAPNEYWFEAGARGLVEALCLAATRVLGIDKTELAGSYRVRGPPPSGGIQGYLELFAHDTTPGGAGFARAVYANLDQILIGAQNLLDSCNCQSTCSRCLSTYDNRRFHEAMDRHYALAMLSLLNTGQVAPLSSVRVGNLGKTVAAALEVVDATASTNMTPTGLTVTGPKGGKLTVQLVPALATRPNATSIAMAVTDYDATFRLPLAVTEILRARKKL